MPHIPAFCDSCGTVFPSGIVVQNVAKLTLAGNRAGPCPVCRSMGVIPDGVFTVVDGVIRVLSAPTITIERLRHLAHVLEGIRQSRSEPSEVVKLVRNEAPELQSVTDALPRTRNELYAFLGVIIVAITAVIAAIALFGDSGPSDVDVQRMVEDAIQNTFRLSPPSKGGP